jgi:putative ABC transport system ATP-binding protein
MTAAPAEGPRRNGDARHPGGISAAAGLSELGAGTAGARTAYGEGALIMCDRLVRIFAADGIEVQALQGLDLLVEEGELTAVVGASGSGKSTLMNILAGLDSPTAGRARVAGHDLAAMTSRERLGYRRSTVGFIWQQTSRNLLPYLTALQNVIMPMRFAGLAYRRRTRRAAELLGVLGLADCAGRMPAQMSGGEQQRIAIGRALAGRPQLLVADEPTSQLDLETGRQIMRLLLTVVRSEGITALVATHDEALMDLADEVLRLEDGHIVN